MGWGTGVKGARLPSSCGGHSGKQPPKLRSLQSAWRDKMLCVQNAQCAVHAPPSYQPGLYVPVTAKRSVYLGGWEDGGGHTRTILAEWTLECED